MGTLVLPILYCSSYKKGVGYGYTGTSYIVLLLL